MPSQRELIFHTADRNFCNDCQYLIGIHTHEDLCDYDIKIAYISANSEEGNFLKMGQEQRSTVDSRETRIYKFIVDENAEFTITQTNRYGDTKSYISLTASKDEAVDEITSSGTLVFTPGSEKFVTAQMYFIIVENTGELLADFTLLITQKHTITELKNGMPL